MKYPKVYALLVQRGAWDDPPDNDEVIAAALDCARDAVMAAEYGDRHDVWDAALAAINSLRGNDG